MEHLMLFRELLQKVEDLEVEEQVVIPVVTSQEEQGQQVKVIMEEMENDFSPLQVVAVVKNKQEKVLLNLHKVEMEVMVKQ